jgi:putative flippase GtrA
LKIVKYFFVGGVAAVVDIGLFFVFAKLLSYNYLAVGCVGFLLATAVNYFLSVRFVFQSGVRFTKKTELMFVYFVSLIGLGLNQAILFALVDQVGAELMFSKLAATAGVFIWNFSARNFIVFRDKS